MGSPTRFVTINNRLYSFTDACEHYGTKPNTARSRIRKGWDVVDAIITSPRQTKKQHHNCAPRLVTYEGEETRLTTLARKHYRRPDTVAHRLNRGMEMSLALQMPSKPKERKDFIAQQARGFALNKLNSPDGAKLMGELVKDIEKFLRVSDPLAERVIQEQIMYLIDEGIAEFGDDFKVRLIKNESYARR